MSTDDVLGSVSYYGSFAWMYGIKRDLWEAATRSLVKNSNTLTKPYLVTLIDYRVPSDTERLWTLNFFPGAPFLCCKQDIYEALIKVIQGGSFLFSYFGDDSIDV